MEAILYQFPFRILGFHADNGSEFVNHTVARLLNKLLAQQFTRSRANRTQDIALVEGKNGAVVRKHIGNGDCPSATQSCMFPWMQLVRRPPAADATSVDYFSVEVLRERRVWNNKRAIRLLYAEWFARIASHLPGCGPIVELGCGAGAFREFLSSVICTDLVPSPWVHHVADAMSLPYRDNSLGAIVAIDTLHHIPEPVGVVREALRTLRPGGRMVLLEPMITPWSQLVWRLFHHEPVDLKYDPFAPEPTRLHRYFANTALPYLLIVRGGSRLAQVVPGLSIRTLEFSDFAVYPLTGGFSRFCLIPAFAVKPLHRLESTLLRPIARRLTAMRLLAVLEKTGS